MKLVKITLCASTQFAPEVIKVRTELGKLGHTALVLEGLEKFTDTEPSLKESPAEVAKAIREHYQLILESDAILVINPDKDGVKNYIGGSVLMEIGFAYVNDKKIYLLNPAPHMAYTAEIEAMQPEVIGGDLSLIK